MLVDGCPMWQHNIPMNLRSEHCTHYTDVHIKVMCDNTTAVSHINNMGGTKSLRCNQQTKLIWPWCEKRSIWLTAAFIPQIENI